MKQRPKLGFAMCGSFCTHAAALNVLHDLAQDYDITPILSFTAAATDTRFGTSALLIENLTAACGRAPVTTIAEAENSVPPHRWISCISAPVRAQPSPDWRTASRIPLSRWRPRHISAPTVRF